MQEPLGNQFASLTGRRRLGRVGGGRKILEGGYWKEALAHKQAGGLEQKEAHAQGGTRARRHADGGTRARRHTRMEALVSPKKRHEVSAHGKSQTPKGHAASEPPEAHVKAASSE